MITERNDDVLNREIEAITRALTKVAIVLCLAVCAIYATPGNFL